VVYGIGNFQSHASVVSCYIGCERKGFARPEQALFAAGAYVIQTRQRFDPFVKILWTSCLLFLFVFDHLSH
jgi:hypothetical protein